MPSPEYDHLYERMRGFTYPESDDPNDYREVVEMTAELFDLDPAVQPDPFDLEGTPAEWLIPEGATGNRTLLYYHGGGYMMGSVNAYRHMVGDLAKAAGIRALHIDYRLAPEHPYPAGLEDSLKAYRWLLTQGVAPGQIVLGGDSAGGGMTLAVLLRLRDAGDPLPAGAFLMSPWTDLTGSGESIAAKDDEDPILQAKSIPRTAEWYAPGLDKTDPILSPLFAELAGLPSLLIQVGTREILLDDSTRFAEKAKAAGVDMTLDVWEDMVHVWPFYAGRIPEGREAIKQMAAFMHRVLA